MHRTHTVKIVTEGDRRGESHTGGFKSPINA